MKNGGSLTDYAGHYDHYICKRETITRGGDLKERFPMIIESRAVGERCR